MAAAVPDAFYPRVSNVKRNALARWLGGAWAPSVRNRDKLELAVKKHGQLLLAEQTADVHGLFAFAAAGDTWAQNDVEPPGEPPVFAVHRIGTPLNVGVLRLTAVDDARVGPVEKAYALQRLYEIAPGLRDFTRWVWAGADDVRVTLPRPHVRALTPAGDDAPVLSEARMAELEVVARAACTNTNLKVAAPGDAYSLQRVWAPLVTPTAVLEWHDQRRWPADATADEKTRIANDAFAVYAFLVALGSTAPGGRNWFVLDSGLIDVRPILDNGVWRRLEWIRLQQQHQPQ